MKPIRAVRFDMKKMVNHYYVNIRPLPIPMSDGQWIYTHHCIAKLFMDYD